MPQEPLKNNGHKPSTQPPETPRFERTPVKCAHCGEEITPFVIDIIDDVAQLRCGRGLMMHAEIACMNCGWVYHWHLNENAIEKMTVKFEKILVQLGVYTPE